MTKKTMLSVYDQASYENVNEGILKTIIADTGYYVRIVYEKIKTTSTLAENITVLYRHFNNQRVWAKIKKQLCRDANLSPLFVVFGRQNRGDTADYNYIVVTSKDVKHKSVMGDLRPDAVMSTITTHYSAPGGEPIFNDKDPCSTDAGDGTRELYLAYMSHQLEFLDNVISDLEKEL